MKWFVEVVIFMRLSQLYAWHGIILEAQYESQSYEVVIAVSTEYERGSD